MIRNRNYQLVIAGLVISLFGSAVQRFCFSLYLLDLTGNAGVFANAMAVSAFPYIFLAPLAGAVADRKNKKYIMICLDLMSGGVIFGYLVLMGYGASKVIGTVLVILLLATISTFYTPSVTAMIPLLVKEEELVKANATVSQVSSIANLAGPLVAGIAYGSIGIQGVTILNGVSFLLSAGLEGLIVFRWKKPERTRISFGASFREMRDTRKYLKEEKRLSWNFILSYGMFNITLVPVLTILLPYVLRSVYHISSEGYGLVEGIVAFGMITGAFLVGKYSKIFPVKTVYRWNYFMILFLGIMAVGSLNGNKEVIFVTWAAAGFVIMAALGIGNVVTLSYTQSVVAKNKLGTVSALSTAIATVSVPVGQYLFGRYLEIWRQVEVLLGVVTAAVLGVVWFLRRAVLSGGDET